MNDAGDTHSLPAVILASVCGHSAGTATYPLRAEHLEEAATLLAPAEAAVHMPHPNLVVLVGAARGVPPDQHLHRLLRERPHGRACRPHDVEFRARLRQ